MRTISRQSEIEEIHKIYFSAFRKIFSYSTKIKEEDKMDRLSVK